VSSSSSRPGRLWVTHQPANADRANKISTAAARLRKRLTILLGGSAADTVAFLADTVAFLADAVAFLADTVAIPADVIAASAAHDEWITTRVAPGRYPYPRAGCVFLDPN
jgi:hypothetical protein